MMPCDWMGMVTIRSETRCRTSTNGMISRSPGWRRPMTFPKRKTTPSSYCLTTLTDIASSTTRTTATATSTTMVVTDMGGSIRAR